MKISAWLSSFISLLFASSCFRAPLLGVEAVTSVDYAPGDTRLLTYSPFCQALTVTYSGSPQAVDIGPSLLYSLSAEPILTSGDSFNFSQSEFLSSSHAYFEWDLHFYGGSEVRVSACINESGSAVYYLIKGKDGFDDWKFHSQTNAVVDRFRVKSNCSSRYSKISEEDQYFLVIQRVESEFQIMIDISVNRTEYLAKNEAQIERSRFNASDSGTVQTPINLGSYILLIYGDSNQSPENWNTIASQFSTDITCEPRIWLYAVIAIGGVLILLLCIVCFACCCVCVVRCYKRRKSSERNPLLHDWDDVGTSIHQYHPYVDRGSKLDNLTELAIAAPDASNPHIAQFKEDIKSPSFQDNYLSSASPKFSTFKP